MRTNADVKRRQKVERMIVRRIVTDAIRLGYTVDVNDGEEVTVMASTSVRKVMAAVMTTDEDYLILHKGKKRGWVRLVYGNDGWDVVNDYTTNLEQGD